MGKEYEYQRREDDINYAKLRRRKVMQMNNARRLKATRKPEEQKKLQAKMEISQPVISMNSRPMQLQKNCGGR